MGQFGSTLVNALAVTSWQFAVVRFALRGDAARVFGPRAEQSMSLKLSVIFSSALR